MRPGPAPPSTNARLSAVKARVLIRPKEGILDPQGKAVERALPALGFDGVSTCGSGGWSSSRPTTAPTSTRLCEQLLANPLVEDYEIVEDG